MSEIQPIGVNVTAPAVTNAPKAEVKGTSEVKQDKPSDVDCSKLYTQKELSDIMKRVGKDCKATVCEYEARFNNDTEALIINNKSMTNDTLEIYKDGSAKHVGSWHNDDVAKAGELLDVIEDAKKRMEPEKK